MPKNVFVIYYTKENRYSYNALLGALDSTGVLDSIEVKLYDPKKSDDTIIDECLSTFDKVVLGISFFTTQVWDTYKEVQRLRRKYGNKLIVIAGGPHPSGEPQSVLTFGFDYVFVGEGEESINEFFIALNRNDKPLQIPGVYEKNIDGEVWFEPRKGKIDLNKYLPFSEKVKEVGLGPIEITRGCPFACHFCQTTSLFGCSVRHRSISFIEEILDIMKGRNRNDFRAITPNALAYGSADGKIVNLEEVYSLLSTIKRSMPNGRIFLGSFPSEVRPEHVTEESMSLLCEFVANDNIIMGAQTGSQRLLDLSHRGHTVSDVYKAVEICVRHNMKPNVDFMFGLPGENSDDVYESIIVMKDLIEMGARIHAHTFMPLPQTPFARKQRGKVNDDIRRMINDINPKNVREDKKIVYGDWAAQARLSQRIEKLLRTKRVDFTDN